MPTTPNVGLPYPTMDDPAVVPSDMSGLALAVDGLLQALTDKIDARDHLVVTHSGDGAWAVTTGLGEPVPIHDAGDGTYQIGA